MIKLDTPATAQMLGQLTHQYVWQGCLHHIVLEARGGLGVKAFDIGNNALDIGSREAREAHQCLDIALSHQWQVVETYGTCRVKTVPILYQMGALVCHNWLEIVAQQGVGLQLNTAAGVGAHPVVRLAFSNDNGVTWSSERMVAIGAQGEYQRRSRTPNLGAARNRVYRVSFTDPTPFILVGLVAGITVGNG